MYRDPRTGVEYIKDEQGLLIEAKNNTPALWSIVEHIRAHLNPPMINGVYVRTRPINRAGHRIEVNSLQSDVDGGILNILIYPSDWEIHNRVVAVLEDAIIEKIKITIERNRSEPPGHIRIKYEHIE